MIDDEIENDITKAAVFRDNLSQVKTQLVSILPVRGRTLDGFLSFVVIQRG